ncbi:TIGR01777 family protein [Hymenobacter sp. UV11]|uniref:TIGR01777 family oxidoreductase n=1 Tax=Hymenobacter sp. UV11 TaxID=1849735 RepID=UPI00106105B2|nr:TIGR01777 family oxidoreductase [Hymenobacter sp. UV11]TDN39198.1 TIGR01777 family protein [Hymenobacter sp. UV11]TFZ63053.1 TIGR01777 family protein [Hymenobacter sp. UV11]
MNVLITGGTGLVGTRLSELLTAAGHTVAWLSRGVAAGVPYRTFRWDLAAGTLDPAAVPFADAVVNLAGASVSVGRWTAARKQELLASRLGSVALLRRELARPGHRVRTVLSASSIEVYGDPGDRLVAETAPLPAPTDFLTGMAQQRERAAEGLALPGIRLVLPRIGLVLSTQSGILSALARPVQREFGAPLGSGRQWLSWIHLDDLCRLLVAMLTDAAWHGPYNAVAPYPATNEAFTEVLAAVLHRPLWLPHTPACVLRLAMGEKSQLALGGQRVSAEKALAQGFAFEYPVLREALRALYGEA